jgi:nucleoid DNA-binding protein
MKRNLVQEIFSNLGLSATQAEKIANVFKEKLTLKKENISIKTIRFGMR